MTYFVPTLPKICQVRKQSNPENWQVLNWESNAIFGQVNEALLDKLIKGIIKTVLKVDKLESGWKSFGGLMIYRAGCAAAQNNLYA